MGKKVDRRVKYTKALLNDALIELLKDNHISKISVKALCEKADVNRSTFYAHYDDIHDLHKQIEDAIIENLKSYLTECVDEKIPITEQTLKGILEYGKANADLFLVMLGENSYESFKQDLIKLIKLVPFQYDGCERTKRYILEFSFTGCISVLRRWLKEGTVETPEEIARLLLKVVYNGLLSL